MRLPLPLLAALAVPSAALDNGLGLVPPLAFSTWNYFNDHISDSLVRELADALVSTGLAEVGFKTLNIDAGYLIHERHPLTDELQVNATKFPHGMRPLADYLNSRGLGLGVYTDHGNGSCGYGPGSYGHYDTDAQTFANWHVDYLKVDFCGTHNGPSGPQNFSDWMDPTQQLELWQQLAQSLNKTGRPIYYSICPHGKPPSMGTAADWYRNGTGYGYLPPLSWSVEDRHSAANSILVEYTNLFDFWYSNHWQDFRHCGPTVSCPTCVYVAKGHGACSRFPNGTMNPAVAISPGGFLTDVDAMVALTKPEYSGPGTWADADMLDVCNFGGNAGGSNAGERSDKGMTLDEYRASYSLWAVFASPIIISADLRTIQKDHPACLAMLKNRELLAIHQDPLASPGRMIRQRTNSTVDPTSTTLARTTNIVEQVFLRPISQGSYALILFNRAEATRNISVSWAELGLPAGWRVRDIWANNDFGADVAGEFEEGYSAEVPAHNAHTLRLSRGK